MKTNSSEQIIKLTQEKIDSVCKLSKCHEDDFLRVDLTNHIIDIMFQIEELSKI